MIFSTVPVHLAQMKKLKTEDEETWNAKAQGGLGVKKGRIPFTTLSSDHNFE